VTLAADAPEAPSVFPDLVGMNARDAARLLARLGVSPRLHGNGMVVSQRPAAGSALDVTDSATLWLERRPPQQKAVEETQPLATGTGGVSRGTP
jgi:beta-lactam-binding protein with PASTA domain